MLLKVSHLRVAFRTEKGLSVPVRDVSFEIPENGRVALVGESGCGKSVTSLAIGGLVDRAEISGTIEGAPRIAYIFQNPMQSLNPVMKVGEQIAEGFRVSRFQMTSRGLRDCFEASGCPKERHGSIRAR